MRSLTVEQLREVVSVDLATQFEEIFSVYLASFWILFVYLHRVSWWHLKHSDIVQRALSEVWRTMQQVYGGSHRRDNEKGCTPFFIMASFPFRVRVPRAEAT